MKDLTLSVVGVIALAVCIGLGFHWLYPRVEPTNELAGLFVFVALVVKLVVLKLWSLKQRPKTPANAGTDK